MKDLLTTISGVDPEKVVREADFIHDLNVDSLGMMEMLLEAEENLGLNSTLPKPLTYAPWEI